MLGIDQGIAELDDTVSQGAAVILTGPAGSGKTALALRWAHQHQRHWPDGILVLGCRGRCPNHRPRSAHELLGIALRELRQDRDSGGLPGEMEGRATQLSETLRDHRMLLLLDDVADVDQVSPLLAMPTTVLITSRNKLPGLAMVEDTLYHHTAPLPADTAAQLLHLLVGAPADGDADALERIVDACDGLPLALRAAAQTILTRPGRSLAELAGDLSGPHRVRHLHHAVGDDARASLDHAFCSSLRHVSQPAAELLLHGARNNVRVVSEVYSDEFAEELVCEHLLSPTSLGYRYPPLVHAWASQHPPHSTSEPSLVA
jgi:hypothetical protein